MEYELSDAEAGGGKAVDSKMETIDTIPVDNEFFDKDKKEETEEKQNLMWGRGIAADVKGTVLPHWVEGVTNFNQKTIAVAFLLFISVVAPTLTFGAVYGKSTGNNMGATEMLLGTSWVGIAYSLLGGMPIAINGATGPVLAFATVLYGMSNSLDVPFLTFNAWVSVWLCAYLILAGFFDLNRIIQYATRFTDEIFAFLIVSIFVLDAIGDPFSSTGLLRYFEPEHASHQKYMDEPNYNYMTTALLSVILGLSTTAFAFFLRGFKFGGYFYNQMLRDAMFDFAVTFSVILWTCIGRVVFDEIPTESLNVPDSFQPTYECCDSSCTTNWPKECPDQIEAWGRRGWFVDLFALNGKGWVPFMAAGPACLALVLVFLDNGITWHIINHPSHNLQHGESYNWDTVLSGIFNLVNGLLGLPWLVATTVPCIIHLNGLAEKDRDGKFIAVQETRLTAFLAHVMLLCCIFALPVLRFIPLPVLYGVFLFMGLAALPNIQFWNRMLLFFQQPSRYPKTPFAKHMKPSRIHLYTVLQMIFFAGVFVVQNVKRIAIVFPLMTLMCIPARLFLFPRIFESWELVLLDGNDEDIDALLEKKENEMESSIVGAYSEDDMEFGESDIDAHEQDHEEVMDV